MKNSPGFEESYLGQLRSAYGKRKLIIPGARGIVLDEENRLLLVRRRDNNQWAMPGGVMELDESIYDCIVREAKEETGIEAASATLIAVNSEPRFSSVDTFGNEFQPLVFVFRVDEWKGSVIRETDETLDARFFPMDELPEIPTRHRESLEDLRNFDGYVIVK